ncbi:MAG: flagellar type III secretion system pore protein FliP [Gammaproteobacteria bacterium]|nr:flagellar type III secretion system pore protein FliP [Gammaproteobacteria bacterium]
MRVVRILAPFLAMFLWPGLSLAETGLPSVTVMEEADGSRTWSLSLQVMLFMTVLTVLPSLVLAMTSFTRIIIVLAIFRQALGTPQTPPNQVLIGLALFLSLFVMQPVLSESYSAGVQPYLAGSMEITDAVKEVARPLRRFMTGQVRETDLAMFAELSGETKGYESPEAVPFSVLVPSFLTSELKTAFQIGFLVFIPFVIIDLVVASVLMSMGMMMLSPMLISLPFKIMLFVLVDGWGLIIGMLASSYFVS